MCAWLVLLLLLLLVFAGVGVVVCDQFGTSCYCGHRLFRWNVGPQGRHQRTVDLPPTLCVYEESESLNRLAKG